MKHLRNLLALVTVLLLPALFMAQAMAANLDDYFQFTAYFRAKIGYQDNGEYSYTPTYINYDGFSHYIAMDGDVLDNDEYALFGSVTEQDTADYIAFICRFGYTVVFDAQQNGVRYVELHDVDAPGYMPQVFRFYYFPEYEALVTIEPKNVANRFARKSEQLWGVYQDETYDNRMLEPGIYVKLAETRAETQYLWADAEHPYCWAAFPNLITQWLGPDKTEITMENGTKMLRMSNEYKDANRNQTSFWLLRLEIATADLPFDPDDWEFCIVDDCDSVYYPFQIGNRLEETDNGLILSTDPALMNGPIYPLWLSFPAYDNNPADRAILRIARTEARTPLLERFSIGFDQPGAQEDEIDWDAWNSWE